MNSDPNPAADEMQTTTAAPIRTLLQAVQRLEEPTQGEVDAVADTHGRSVLLPSGLAHLLENETLPLRAILNSLPANIALLDKDGVILATNQAWREFGSNNSSSAISAISPDSSEVGENYLAICDSATGPDAVEAPEVATAIRSILSGQITSYSVEYPCHSPTAKRWFLLTVTPSAERSQQGAVVMHFDITSRKTAEESQRRIANAMDAMGDAVHLIDRASMSDSR